MKKERIIQLAKEIEENMERLADNPERKLFLEIYKLKHIMYSNIK